MSADVHPRQRLRTAALVAAAVGAVAAFVVFRGEIGSALGGLTDAIKALGLAGIPLLAAGDTLGLPATGDAIVLFWAAQKDESLVAIWVLAVAGGMVGDSIAYWIGRLGGARLVHRFLDPAREQRLGEIVRRHAAPVIVFGRMIAGIRSKAAVLSGIGRYPYPRYLLWDAVGCALWAAVFVVLGRLVGSRVLEWAHGAERYVLIGVGVLVVGFVARALWRRHRRPEPAAEPQ